MAVDQLSLCQDIPDKLYFRIGEVAELAGVPSYVLRFWESEFASIRPKRTDSGQRLYRKNDVETILTIKHLLHEKRFTIEGAKQHLHGGEPVDEYEFVTEIESYEKQACPDPPDFTADNSDQTILLREIFKELQHIRDLLG